MTFYRNKLLIETNAVKRIELNRVIMTLQRSFGRLRITSSNVKSIDQCRSTTASAPLVYSNFKGNAVSQYGLAQERVSSIKYLEWLKQSGSTGAAINRNCGLVISATHPWLAAMPDAWVKDPSASPPEGLVEFKNPFSYKDLLAIIRSLISSVHIVSWAPCSRDLPHAFSGKTSSSASALRHIFIEVFPS